MKGRDVDSEIAAGESNAASRRPLVCPASADLPLDMGQRSLAVVKRLALLLPPIPAEPEFQRSALSDHDSTSLVRLLQARLGRDKGDLRPRPRGAFSSLPASFAMLRWLWDRQFLYHCRPGAVATVVLDNRDRPILHELTDRYSAGIAFSLVSGV